MMRAPAIFTTSEITMSDDVRRALALLCRTETGEIVFLVALIAATCGLLSVGGM